MACLMRQSAQLVILRPHRGRAGDLGPAGAGGPSPVAIWDSPWEAGSPSPLFTKSTGFLGGSSALSNCRGGAREAVGLGGDLESTGGPSPTPLSWAVVNKFSIAERALDVGCRFRLSVAI